MLSAVPVCLPGLTATTLDLNLVKGVVVIIVDTTRAKVVGGDGLTLVALGVDDAMRREPQLHPARVRLALGEHHGLGWALHLLGGLRG